MIQELKIRKIFNDSSYKLLLREIYEETEKLVVLLVIEEDKSGFADLAFQRVAVDLKVELKTSTQVLPVTYLFMESIKDEPNSTLPGSEERNSVKSKESLGINADATCLYKGRLNIPTLFAEGMQPKVFEIIDGDASEVVIKVQSVAQAKASDIGVFASPPSMGAAKNDPKTPSATRSCIMM